MKISTKGRYALLIMINLAKNYDSKKYLSLKEISEKENISLKYLEKIMLLLNKNNYLETARGNNGGYRLNKSPDKYLIGDILRTVEGNLTPVSCLENKEECSKKKCCDSYLFWDGLYKEITDYIDSKTLADYI